MRILQIEDDAQTSRLIELSLVAEGFSVFTVDTGEEGVELAKTYEYDAILLDLGLPDMSGLEALRAMRAARVAAPVMIVTGSADTEREVSCLKAGADDFLRKPFHRDVLVQRLHALVRRSYGHATAVITVGPIAIDVASKTVRVAENAVHTTGKEFRILQLLAQRKGQTLSKGVLMDHLYGGMDEAEEKIIDVFICKIRTKLRRHGAAHQIETVWGRGYRLVAEPTEPALHSKNDGAPPALSMKGQVLSLLAQGDATYAEIRALNRFWSDASVRATVSGLKQDGRILNVGTHGAAVYRLTPKDYLAEAERERDAAYREALSA